MKKTWNSLESQVFFLHIIKYRRLHDLRAHRKSRLVSKHLVLIFHVLLRNINVLSHRQRVLQRYLLAVVAIFGRINPFFDCPDASMVVDDVILEHVDLHFTRKQVWHAIVAEI